MIRLVPVPLLFLVFSNRFVKLLVVVIGASAQLTLTPPLTSTTT
jgi:hypothetical protein